MELTKQKHLMKRLDIKIMVAQQLDQYHQTVNYQNQIENLNLQIQESELKANEIQNECQYTTDKWQKILDEGIKDVKTNCEARNSRVVMERIQILTNEISKYNKINQELEAEVFEKSENAKDPEETDKALDAIKDQVNKCMLRIQ